jgi:hypothetical protein
LDDKKVEIITHENNKISFGTFDNKNGKRPSNWQASDQSTVKHLADASGSLFNS